MELSKLNPTLTFFPQTQLPQTPKPQHLTLPPSTNHPPLHLKTHLLIPPATLPKLPPRTTTIKQEREQKSHHYNTPNDSLSVAFPSLAFSNTLFFSSAYQVQVVVGEDEPEERLVSRFRREVLKAGVIQESKRRRFFETSQEKRKRKKREAAKRNKKRRPRPKVSKEVKAEPSRKTEDADNDNWEFYDVDLPYN